MANDRQITLAGDFKQSVNITNSLTNGESCSADYFGHAEGYKSHSHGKYSYAGGYSAYAKDNNSYVWSGKGSGSSYQSNGEGTYNIYTGSVNTDPLKYIYVDGSTIDSRISSTFSSVYLNTNLLSRTNTWSKKNTYSGAQNGGIILDGVNLVGNSNSAIELANGSTATFNGTAKAKTLQFDEKNSAETGVGKLDDIATTQYVKNAFAASLNSISENYVKRGNATTAIGSASKPVYIDASGNAVAITDNVVFRGDESTAGNNLKPIYMKDGSIVPSNASVGDTVTPMYMKGGTFTKLSGSVGDDEKSIVYLKDGTITKSTETVGSSLRPVFLKNGSITPIGVKDNGDDFNFGGPKQPIYINKGVITLCDQYSTGGGGGGITSVLIDEGGAVSTNKFVTNLAAVKDPNGVVKIYANQVRPTMDNIYRLRDEVDSKGVITAEGSLSIVERKCSSLASSIVTLNNNVSSLHTNIPLVYAPKFNPKVTGTGNVLSSVTFENNGASINLQRGITALTVANTDGTGNVLTNLTYSGATATATKGYAVTSVTGQRSSGTANQFVNALSYSNGTLSVGWGEAQTGGVTGSLKHERLNVGGSSTYRSASATHDGIVFVHVSSTWKDVHIIDISIGGHIIKVESNKIRSPMVCWWVSKGNTVTATRSDADADLSMEAEMVYFE